MRHQTVLTECSFMISPLVVYGVIMDSLHSNPLRAFTTVQKRMYHRSIFMHLLGHIRIDWNCVPWTQLCNQWFLFEFLVLSLRILWPLKPMTMDSYAMSYSALHAVSLCLHPNPASGAPLFHALKQNVIHKYSCGTHCQAGCHANSYQYQEGHY